MPCKPEVDLVTGPENGVHTSQRVSKLACLLKEIKLFFAYPTLILSLLEQLLANGPLQIIASRGIEHGSQRTLNESKS